MLVTKSSQLPLISLAKVWNSKSSAPAAVLAPLTSGLHPECLVSLRLLFGGEEPGEDHPHPQAVSGGRGHSSYQPSRLLGAQTQSQRPSTACTETCFTGQRQPITRGLLVGKTGWTSKGPGPGAPGLGDPLSVPGSHIGCSSPYHSGLFSAFPPASFCQLLERITSKHLEEVCSWL